MSESGSQPAQVQLVRQPTSPELLQQFAEGGFLFAIVDGAGEPMLAALLRDLASRAAPMRIAGEAQQEITPCVLPVDPLLLEWLYHTVWRKPWGVFVLADAAAQTLAEHFARFLLATLPDGERWFFRFYDPRVLGPYLSNCSRQESAAFFGPARAFALVDPDSGVELVRQAEDAAEAHQPGQSPAAWGMRPSQVAVLATAAVDPFDARVALHLRQYFPQQCQQLGDQHLRDAIEFGIDRARSYGIELERDVCIYLDLMFTFGVEFDREIPWAAGILHQPGDPSAKVQKLFEEAAHHVQKAVGSGVASSG